MVSIHLGGERASFGKVRDELLETFWPKKNLTNKFCA